MDAEIIAIGTELLLGQHLDTNSSWLARNLALLGVNLYHIQAVGDNEKRLEEALALSCGRSDFVVATGGLGPTVDDVTRKVAARLSRKQLVFHENLGKEIEERFLRQGKPCPKVNLNQAFIPQGAVVIPNPVGTAPGFIVKAGRAQLACLPGVPSEMQAMFEATLAPYLKSLGPAGTLIKSRVFRTTGLSESSLNERILDLFERSSNPTVGVLAHPEGVDIRLTAKAENEAQADKLIAGLGKSLTEKLPTHIYGWDQDELETIVGRLLATRHLTLALAESCTGGLIAHRLTQVPGSSGYFNRAYVTYSDQSKEQLLKVDRSVLKSKGAVSRETAERMAKGCREADGADLGLATTGIAGPSGGSPEKPVGLVYISLAEEHGVHVFEHRFSGSRDVVKRKAAQAALELVRRHCLQLPLQD